MKQGVPTLHQKQPRKFCPLTSFVGLRDSRIAFAVFDGDGGGEGGGAVGRRHVAALHVDSKVARVVDSIPLLPT